MASRAKIPQHARDYYDDIDLAIKELGTLWVLDRINTGLAYTKKRREEMRDKRATYTDPKDVELERLVNKQKKNLKEVLNPQPVSMEDETKGRY